jgi:tripartite-type tricarboxylate transporter receptor subunit TctC
MTSLQKSIVLAALGAMCAGPAAAGAVADFYSGKKVTMIVGSGAGGGYGLNGRLLGKYLGNHIPGKPTIIMQFMQGQGGVKAANYVYTISPKDGSVISVPISSIVESQLLRPKGIKFDGAKFNWLGSITALSSVLSIWHTTPAKTIDDAKKTQIVLGSPSGHSFIYRMPKLMNALLGTKFKIIVGYKGSRGVDMALEKGEIQGRAMVWASTKAKRPHWLKAGKLTHLIQIGPTPVSDLPGLPRFVDLVKGEKAKAMVRFLHVTGLIGRALHAPPGVPKARVTALRRAFDATMKDPAFIAEFTKRKLPYGPTTGEKLQSFIVSVFDTPKSTLDELKAALASK